MLIDSGSSSSFISNELYETLRLSSSNLNFKKFNGDFKTANGSPLNIIGSINLEFFLGELSFIHEFYVADIDDVGILGSDFMTEYEVGLFISAGYMTIGDTRIELWSERSNTCNRVKLSERLIIPPGTEVLAKGYVVGEKSIGDHVMLEPCKHIGGKGVLVASALVNPSDVVLSVVNMSSRQIDMKQHTMVAYLQEVDSVSTGVELNTSQDNAETVPSHLKEMFENASENLTADQSNDLENVLIQYQDVFVGPDGKLGRNNWVNHTINTENTKPITIPPRRVPMKQKEIIDIEIDKMLQNDIIEPSNSPWSSPILLCSKKDGSTRFCIDFRKLNSMTVKDAYPLPRIDDSLEALSDNVWFHSLDLASGYWQCGVEPQDQCKTAFSSHRGLFQFKVLPFGLCNAPATFERLMEMVLKGLNFERCLCYLDDVIIFGKTFESALENLKMVLDRFRTANLKLKPSKCALFQTKCSFLGHVVQKEGISCDPSKVETVVNWPKPTNVSEVRSILGLAGYYRKFIKNFSTIAYPLVNLTKKDAKFVWTDECQIAFETLKSMLVSSPILAYPMENEQFILDTDASLCGIGAVLSQIQNGEERVISYASKTLNKAQQRYCTTYRELLAVVTFVKYFRHFLWGRKVIVRTDHSALKWLHNFKSPEGMIARWLSVLGTYDLDIHHRKGSLHANADALSRKPHRLCKNPDCSDCFPGNDKISNPTEITFSETPSNTLQHVGTSDCNKSQAIGDKTRDNLSFIEGNDLPDVMTNTIGVEQNLTSCSVVSPEQNDYSWLSKWSLEELRNLQRKDVAIGRIVKLKSEYHEKPSRNTINAETQEVKTLWGLWETLLVKDGVLYYKWFCEVDGIERLLLVAPKQIRSSIFKELHCNRTAGHFGRRRTIDSIRRRFYWPGMSSHIRLWVKQCNQCARRKPGPGLAKSPLQQYQVFNPLDRIAIDILECPISDSGNQYVIVVQDYFTKWVECYPVPNHTAVTVADKLTNEFISRFGTPKQIHTDQGREFESKLFALLCEKLEIEKTRTCPYRPQSDGMVERFNRTLLQMLSVYVNSNHSNWDEHIPFLLMAYRSTIHESTGCSPNRLMLGREINYPIDIVSGNPQNVNSPTCSVEYIEWFTQVISRTFDFAFANLGQAASRQKKNYDKGLKPRSFKESDFVWRWYPPIARTKLGLGWTGPYKVIQKLSDVTYKIQKDSKSSLIVVHVDHLKPYEGNKPPLNWQDSLLGEEHTSTSQDTDSDMLIRTRYGRECRVPDRYGYA